ncbi:OR14I1 [Branchiostoma lanceolatum]|uniref:OR14I1 protein n=1 Tax=Branchiostoma lanceolatum TaxID=7740 RepID=A0A8K0EJ71_BRALA|nr:OR14I1 [Branchiostoma lanceolatum]
MEEEEAVSPSAKDGINDVLSVGSTSRGLQTTYLIISLALSVGCGLLLIFLVWKKEYLQKPSHYLRCNLAVDDIIFTSCLIPIRVYALFRQDASGDHLWCSAKLLAAPALQISMFGTYLMMAVDLYYAVCDPLHYHDKVNVKRVVVGIVTIRAYSLIFVLGSVAFGGLPKYGLCHEYDPINSISLLTVFRSIGLLVYFLVCLFIPMLYFRVFKEARRQQERDENRDLWVFQTKAFKMMAPHAIVFTVSVSTGIFQVAMGRALISKEQKSQYGLIIADHVSILLFMTLPSIVNPIIYSFRLSDFRRACRELCGVPTNTPVVPAPRHRGTEIPAIASPGQGASGTESVPACIEGQKMTKDEPFGQSKTQTTQADTNPRPAPPAEYRNHNSASKRPFQLTVMAEVYADPTPCSAEGITETLPGQTHLDAESADASTLTLDAEIDKATYAAGHTMYQFAVKKQTPACPKIVWQDDKSQCNKSEA